MDEGNHHTQDVADYYNYGEDDMNRNNDEYGYYSQPVGQDYNNVSFLVYKLCF